MCNSKKKWPDFGTEESVQRIRKFSAEKCLHRKELYEKAHKFFLNEETAHKKQNQRFISGWRKLRTYLALSD